MALRSPLVDAYHARLPAAARTALEQIRASVHAAAPAAEECLSYGMPAVTLDGKPLVAWRAAATYGAFHPLSGSTVATCREWLGDYETSKGTIRFPFDGVLPPKLVKRLVATRIDENFRLGKAAAAAGRTVAKKPVAKKPVAKKAVAKKPVARKKAVAAKVATRSVGRSSAAKPAAGTPPGAGGGATMPRKQTRGSPRGGA